jgi:predicted enzyme related to lactoylglutathione lyase
VGRFAIVGDPQGAVFALLQPDGPKPIGPDEAPALHEVSWRELATSDLEAAKAFYHELFGWELLAANDMGAIGVYQEFGRFGRPQGGMFKKTEEMKFPPQWVVYARVPDIHESLAAVKQLGGTILNGPTEIPGGDLIAQILDPQGASFALHQMKG